jgi:glycerate kinase
VKRTRDSGSAGLRVLAAPDKFRGTATASEVAAAMAVACAQLGWDCTQLPLADGGEGTLDVLGGPNRTSLVTGPLGAPIEAAWRLDGELAVIEMAQASGLLVAGGRESNDPMRATSRGTGELIAIARRFGARRVIVGVGGSASTDGGAGAVEALADEGALDGSTGFSVIVATDVRTCFVDAVATFGPQKGATTSQLATLTRRLEDLAVHYRRTYGIDVRSLPGSGAAGGLAGGLAALGARIESGFELIQSELGLYGALGRADLVITGEGRLDDASFDGKVVGGVLAAARAVGVGGAVIVGQSAEGMTMDATLVDLSTTYGPTRSMTDTAACITEATLSILGASHAADAADAVPR